MERYKPVKLAYELFEPKCGSDDRLSPLIFLHGIGFTSDVSWGDLPQICADQTKRKAFTLDARNHGDSEWSDEFDYDLNVEDLLHFINEKGFPKVVIVGHSMGGSTGIKAALRAPERIEMLISEDQFVKKVPQFFMNYGIKYMSLWREAEKLIYPEINKKSADKFVTNYILHKLDPKNSSIYQQFYWKDVSYPLRKDSLGRYFFKVNLEVILEKLKDVESLKTENEGSYDGPSCFLYATDSPFEIDKEKHHILKHFPKAVFVPFDSAGHLIHTEFSNLFVETIVKFIKQNENSQ